MKKSKFSKAVSGILNGAVGMCEKAVKSPRFGMVLAMLCMVSVTFAQNSAGDYSAGTTALGTVTTEIAKYVPVAVKLCYAIAGVVAVVGAISVYIKMNNEEQDVKKSIMMLVGACIFLIAAAQALPLNILITKFSRGFSGLLNSWVFRDATSTGLRERLAVPSSRSSSAMWPSASSLP